MAAIIGVFLLVAAIIGAVPQIRHAVWILLRAPASIQETVEWFRGLDTAMDEVKASANAAAEEVRDTNKIVREIAEDHKTTLDNHEHRLVELETRVTILER